MLTIEDLSDSLGLSKYQVRRRIKALDNVISDHVRRGDNSKILVNSGGLEILRRLEALRDEGLTIDEAVEEIREETGESPSANQRETSTELNLLRERIDHLESENKYLRKKLDQKENQIQQLLPATQEEEKEEEDEFKEMGFFGIVKKWLTTKT